MSKARARRLRTCDQEDFRDSKIRKSANAIWYKKELFLAPSARILLAGQDKSRREKARINSSSCRSSSNGLRNDNNVVKKLSLEFIPSLMNKQNVKCKQQLSSKQQVSRPIQTSLDEPLDERRSEIRRAQFVVFESHFRKNALTENRFESQSAKRTTERRLEFVEM